MKLVSHYLESIDGIVIYPIISFLIFVTVFSLITIYTLRLKKSRVKEMKNMPLDDNETDINLINE